MTVLVDTGILVALIDVTGRGFARVQRPAQLWAGEPAPKKVGDPFTKPVAWR
jgi:hypothetical protein